MPLDLTLEREPTHRLTQSLVPHLSSLTNGRYRINVTPPPPPPRHHCRIEWEHHQKQQQLRYSSKPCSLPLLLLHHGSGSSGSRLLLSVGPLLPDLVTPFYTSMGEAMRRMMVSTTTRARSAGWSRSWGTPTQCRCATSGCRSYNTVGRRVSGLSPSGVTGSSSRSLGSVLSPMCVSDPTRLASFPKPTTIQHLRYSTTTPHPCLAATPLAALGGRGWSGRERRAPPSSRYRSPSSSHFLKFIWWLGCHMDITSANTTIYTALGVKLHRFQQLRD